MVHSSLIFPVLLYLEIFIVLVLDFFTIPEWDFFLLNRFGDKYFKHLLIYLYESNA